MRNDNNFGFHFKTAATAFSTEIFLLGNFNRIHSKQNRIIILQGIHRYIFFGPMSCGSVSAEEAYA